MSHEHAIKEDYSNTTSFGNQRMKELMQSSADPETKDLLEEMLIEKLPDTKEHDMQLK